MIAIAKTIYDDGVVLVKAIIKKSGIEVMTVMVLEK